MVKTLDVVKKPIWVKEHGKRVLKDLSCEELLDMFRPFIIKQAKSAHTKLYNVEFEDLVQEYSIAVVHCFKTYDASKGNQFFTLLFLQARNVYCKLSVRHSKNAEQRAKKYRVTFVESVPTRGDHEDLETRIMEYAAMSKNGLKSNSIDNDYLIDLDRYMEKYKTLKISLNEQEQKRIKSLSLLLGDLIEDKNHLEVDVEQFDIDLTPLKALVDEIFTNQPERQKKLETLRIISLGIRGREVRSWIADNARYLKDYAEFQKYYRQIKREQIN